MSNGVNIRMSIQELLDAYDAGKTEPLENLVAAWKGIQDLPYDDPNSFFVLGGYHGEPFQYRTPQPTYLYWGGWCNHGNILFPTWHRVYLYNLEKALQSIVPGVMLPYWDETSAASLKGGVPWIFTTPDFPKGSGTPNPLYSFTFPIGVTDDLNEPAAGDPVNEYTKPAGYQTVRYPLSGLVGTPAAQQQTEAHNAQYPDPDQNGQLLSDNVMAWLHGAGANGQGPTTTDPNPTNTGIYWMFLTSLYAPNYTVFSNTTSAGQWNTDNPGAYVVPLEQPHNDIHLSVGGFDLPAFGQSGQIAEANGDMGENNTAGLDPIFFFHHCNVDRMFWVWQKQNGFTDSLGDILGPDKGQQYYPGTSSSDSQGPTPDYAPDTLLTLESPLQPFVKEGSTYFISNDAVNIETQLGYTYTIGSLDTTAQESAAKLVDSDPATADGKLAATGIDRSLFHGSFVVNGKATVKNDDGTAKEYHLGHHSVLNRYNTVNCANCLNHLEVKAHFPLTNVPEEDRDKADYSISFQHRGNPGVLKAAPMDAKEGFAPKRAAALPAGLEYSLKVID
jgi:tyrosinase